jgi:AraC-like DNA-binding protein
MQMTYTHDFGLSVVLKSGKVLLAGGCEREAGIGQTINAEIYDPQTRTFRGFGNLQRGRVMASALELDSGQVVIAGNWYAQDGIELFHEHQSDKGDNVHKRSFTHIKDVSAQRSNPYIFRMADGDALILGNNSTMGDTLHCTFADRLKGDTLHIPLFESWSPLNAVTHNDAMSFIGDEPDSGFTYLMPVQDSIGQVAIVRVSSTDMTLLPTVCPIPMSCQGDSIEYFSNVIVDRQAHRAYLLGISSKVHAATEKNPLYVLCINYDLTSANGGAPMTLYYTQPLEVVPDCMPLLTPKGNLLMAGGLSENSNYTPSSAVWLFRVGGESEEDASGFAWWIWILLIVVILAVVAILVYKHRFHGKKLCDTNQRQNNETAPVMPDSELINRISRLMEEQKLYLNSELKLGDVATALNTNRNAISSIINTQCNSSFTQFVNTYRINYAKELIRRQPDIKISEVWTASGFTTESSFFRTFKSIVGMPPSEWKQKKD